MGEQWVDAFRARLVFALVGGTALQGASCGGDERSMQTPGSGASPAQPPATATATATAAGTGVVAAGSTTSATITAMGASTGGTTPTVATQPKQRQNFPGGQCFTPFGIMASMGTGEPAPQEPMSAFDQNGCLPKSLVRSSCCMPAQRGPIYQGGECCYSFPKGMCCGRPFMVDGIVRVAPLHQGEGWVRRNPANRLLTRERLGDELDASTRAALSSAWARAGQMEHASVASFLRFGLELMALGAPARFIADATLAAQDEVHHAELCFSLAAALGDVNHAPQAFSLEGVMLRYDLRAVVTGVVLEGCVGETVAAVVAAHERDGARDPAVQSALARIAKDEARHAELAWRFLRWAIAEHGDDAREAAREALALAERRGGCVPVVEPEDAVWIAYGRTPPALEPILADRVWSSVIAPCARELLE